MAFTCRECALKACKTEQERKNTIENWEWMSRMWGSWGPCETCKQVGGCIND